MALAQGRAAEILALLAPLVLAAPLAKQIGGVESSSSNATPMRGVLLAGMAVLLVAGTLAFTSMHRYEPHTRGSPVAAVAALKKLNLARVFNDYDFGGYLIANGVAPFIDGRTELYGEKFFVDHNAASGLMEPENLFRLLEEYKIDATLMRTPKRGDRNCSITSTAGRRSIPTTSPRFMCESPVRCTRRSRWWIRRRSEFVSFTSPGRVKKYRRAKQASAATKGRSAIEKIYTRAKKLSSRKRRNVLQRSSTAARRFPTAKLSNSPQKTSQGRRVWPDPIPVICLTRIPARNAASRSPRRTGLKTVRAASLISGIAGPAITGSRRWHFTMLRTRAEKHSPPDGRRSRNGMRTTNR